MQAHALGTQRHCETSLPQRDTPPIDATTPQQTTAQLNANNDDQSSLLQQLTHSVALLTATVQQQALLIDNLTRRLNSHEQQLLWMQRKLERAPLQRKRRRLHLDSDVETLARSLANTNPSDSPRMHKRRRLLPPVECVRDIGSDSDDKSAEDARFLLAPQQRGTMLYGLASGRFAAQHLENATSSASSTSSDANDDSSSDESSDSDVAERQRPRQTAAATAIWPALHSPQQANVVLTWDSAAATTTTKRPFAP